MQSSVLYLYRCDGDRAMDARVSAEVLLMVHEASYNLM